MKNNNNYLNISSKVKFQNWENDSIFNENLPKIINESVPIPRDDNNIGHVQLYKDLHKNNVNIHTSDYFKDKDYDLEFHFHYNMPIADGKEAYLIIPEVYQVYYLNKYKYIKSKYKKIFTNFDDEVDNNQFLKINHPVPLDIPEITGFKERNVLACLIGSNKTLQYKYSNCGYTKRVEIINYFENNYLEDFNLFGTGWEKPFYHPTFIGKIKKRLWRLSQNYYSITHFPSYNGWTISKKNTLQNYKYVFCYENAIGVPGYFCELIFDAFSSGTVPIYWGASNVEQYIPENCFVDRRNFLNNRELVLFLKSTTENQYIDYQKNIINFIKSPKSDIFKPETYSKVIIDELKKDYKI